MDSSTQSQDGTEYTLRTARSRVNRELMLSRDCLVTILETEATLMYNAATVNYIKHLITQLKSLQ